MMISIDYFLAESRRASVCTNKLINGGTGGPHWAGCKVKQSVHSLRSLIEPLVVCTLMPELVMWYITHMSDSYYYYF